jgi:hypothetical protein
MKEKNHINMSIEIWEDGKKTETLSQVSSEIKGGFEGDFIVSVKEMNDKEIKPKYEVTMALVDDNGGSASGVTIIEKKKSHIGSTTINLNEKLEIPDHEEVMVWGFQTTDENHSMVNHSIPKTVEGAKWAMVFKISLRS